MPVTARLSKKFYERLGEDVANELVDWFNAVDSTYQTQLRELNDRNFERFRTELRAESATIRAELTAVIETKTANLRADLFRWMLAFWTATIIPLGGFVLGLFTILR